MSFVKSDAVRASEKEWPPLWSELSRWLASMVNEVTENIYSIKYLKLGRKIVKGFWGIEKYIMAHHCPG